MSQSNQNTDATNRGNCLLSGIRVLDLSRILAGPWATQMLADYGATVWKIEKPDGGDDTRQWGPPFIDLGDEDLSAYFATANRGKKSVCIDFTQPQGQQLILKLATQADIVVENFKVGGLKKYGLDYQSLSKLNPALIYCSITGFGQTGPMAGLPGYDAMIQATGGLMSITGGTDEEGGEPQKVGVAVADLMTGMYATTAILAALNYRNTTGKGQHIDLALLDTQLAMLANQGMNCLVNKQPPQRQGNAHPNIVPYQTFRCSDGYLMLAVGNDSQFQSACRVMGVSELAKEERFKTNENRVENRQLLISLLTSVIEKKPRDNWLQNFALANVPCGPVNDIAQAFDLPQVKHRQMVFETRTKSGHSLPQIANPAQFSQVELCYEIAPPLLGVDTIEVLNHQVGLTSEQLIKLKDEKIIFANSASLSSDLPKENDN